MAGKAPLIILNNAVAMPALGLGVYQASPEDTVQAVATAIASGYRLIDTARAYRNEAGPVIAGIGRALGKTAAQAILRWHL